jgi:hypothetical protein
MISPAVRECVELARYAVDGAWPILAGTIDQSASFLDVYRQVKGEDATWKARLMAGE